MSRTSNVPAVSLAVVMLLVVQCVFAAAPTITFDAPHGGEVYAIGQVQTVRLAATTRPKFIIIELSRDGGGTYEALGTINNMVPDVNKRNVLPFLVTAPASSNCLVRATGAVGKTTYVADSSPFSIGSAGAQLPQSITAAALPPQSVGSDVLADGAVTTPKLADKAATAAKIGSEAASGGMVLEADGNGGATWAGLPGIADASVTNGKLANSSLTVKAGTGLSGGGTVVLGGTTTLSLANVGLAGDVVGTQSATVVSLVGGQTAANVASGANAANAATTANAASTIVARDSSGNFSAGTVTAALNGNAATATSAGNITGTVAIANGGTGQTNQQAAINALTGTQSAGRYLRSDGTNASLSVLQAADVTGAVAIGKGGTGQTTANAALNALLPAQASGSGKVLTTDGSNTSWAPPVPSGYAILGNSTTPPPGYSYTGSSVGNSNATWTTKAAMPTAREGLAAASVNGIIYAIGGSTGPAFPSTTSLNTVEAYDPMANSWTTKAAMPTARYGLAAATVNGIIYAIGGNGGPGYLNTVQAYDPVANSWTTKTAMPTARSYLSAATVNGIIYAIGGENASSPFLNTVEAYDPVANSWTTKAALPAMNEMLSAATVNGIIYAIGGTNSPPPELKTVQAYDPGANSWTTKSPMPTGRYFLAAVTANGVIYAIGGNDYYSYLNTNEAYDPVANSWTTKGAMPTAREGLAAASVNGIIYAIGGYNGSRLNTVEAFYDAANVWFVHVKN